MVFLFRRKKQQTDARFLIIDLTKMAEWDCHEDQHIRSSNFSPAFAPHLRLAERECWRVFSLPLFHSIDQLSMFSFSLFLQFPSDRAACHSSFLANLDYNFQSRSIFEYKPHCQCVLLLLVTTRRRRWSPLIASRYAAACASKVYFNDLQSLRRERLVQILRQYFYSISQERSKPFTTLLMRSKQTVWRCVCVITVKDFPNLSDSTGHAEPF